MTVQEQQPPSVAHTRALDDASSLHTLKEEANSLEVNTWLHFVGQLGHACKAFSALSTNPIEFQAIRYDGHINLPGSKTFSDAVRHIGPEAARRIDKWITRHDDLESKMAIDTGAMDFRSGRSQPPAVSGKRMMMPPDMMFPVTTTSRFDLDSQISGCSSIISPSHKETTKPTQGNETPATQQKHSETVSVRQVVQMAESLSSKVMSHRPRNILQCLKIDYLEIVIRNAQALDLIGCKELYDYFVMHTGLTKDLHPSTFEGWQMKFKEARECGHPFLVAEFQYKPGHPPENGDKKLVLGFAIVSPYTSEPRDVFEGCVKAMIYVKQEFQGLGIGKSLLDGVLVSLDNKYKRPCDTNFDQTANFLNIRYEITKSPASARAITLDVFYRDAGVQDYLWKQNCLLSRFGFKRIAAANNLAMRKGHFLKMVTFMREVAQ